MLGARPHFPLMSPATDTLVSSNARARPLVPPVRLTTPARAPSMTIPIVNGVNPLQTTLFELGIVSGRVALLLRSAEIQPGFVRFSTSSTLKLLLLLLLPRHHCHASTTTTPLLLCSPPPLLSYTSFIHPTLSRTTTITPYHPPNQPTKPNARAVLLAGTAAKPPSQQPTAQCTPPTPIALIASSAPPQRRPARPPRPPPAPALV